MTWTSYRNRGETLRLVTDAADARRDGEIPRDVAGYADAFVDDADLLGALLLRWYTRLAGRIEREILLDPHDLPRAVITAWSATAEEQPGIRAILDRHADAAEAGELGPDLAAVFAKAAAKERTMLALMAGLASAPGVATEVVGARLEEEARSAVRVARTQEPVRLSLIDRLRAALAA